MIDKPKHGFRLELRCNSQEAIDRIRRTSDTMELKNDKDAWLFFLRGYGGNSTYQHQLQGESMFVQKRSGPRSSQYGLRISFETTPTGCSLIASRSMNPQTKGFFWFWFGGVILLGGVVSISILFQVFTGEQEPTQGLWALLPIAMLAFGWLFILIGRALAKKQIVEMEEWLRTIFADVLIEGR